MRKLQICFYLFLLILLVSSCSKYNDAKIRYKTEKAFFRAEKLKETLMVNPQAARAEDYQKVIDAYHKVIKMLPSSMSDTSQQRQVSHLAGSSQLRIADIYLLQNNPSQAITELQKVLEDYPQNSTQTSLALYKMAQIHQRMGDWEKALKNYHLLLDPDKYPPIIAKDKPNLELLSVPLNLILLSKDKKGAKLEFENAKKYYQKIIQGYPNSPLSFAAKVNLSKTYQLRGDWRQTIKILETVADSSGEVPPSILMEVGNIYLSETNDANNARLAFEKLISKYPTNPLSAQALLRIGNIHYQGKNYLKARGVLSKISNEFPKQGKIIAQAQYLIAQSYEKEGRWDRAVNEFEWITTNLPATIQAMEVPLHIASYYQEQDDSKLAQTFYDKAINQYQKLLEKYPKTQTELLALKYTARCYTLQNKWEEGIKALQEIVDKHPQTVDAFEALLTQATIYEQKLNQREKAKEVYSTILSKFPKHPSTPQIRRKMENL